MDRKRWEVIEETFEKAVDLPPEERELYLRDACAGDEELELEIRRMLEADDNANDFIESPAFASPTYEELLPTIENSAAPHLIGERIGQYELIRELGRGGMGAVFLARRADREFEQLAAIKLIKRGMDTDFILKRFRNERQILASLNHPYVARLLDGGTTSDGLPYFVMEYVRGEPIHLFCDSRRLSVAERLELFKKVCVAVHYAHQNLIIHRDLKPGNILVTDDLDLKLLDFGIAKILDPEFEGDSLAHTVTGMRLMTPEYASPEQVRGEDLTPASDIYSLGILLFELLAGRRPYRFPSKAPHDVARVICEDEPLDPVFALENPSDDETESAESIAQNRTTTREALKKELGGELRSILLKALRKSPMNRYPSALEFSKDVESYLAGKPISAPSPDSQHFPVFESSLRLVVSLAVLPFQCLNLHDRDRPNTGDFLSLGLADALITRLSNLKNIVVRPTSSILRFAREGMADPQEAGRKLNASYVLDGRIQQSDKRVRVTAQLIKTEDNETVWAGHFEEQSDDLLSLQDSISAQVSDALVATLAARDTGELEERGTSNAKAYEAYLRGRFHWHSYTVDGLAKALVYFYEAIALDPDFARPYSGVADYYNFLSIFGIMPPNESFPAAKEAALKAIELDPDLAEAYISLGIVAFGYDWDNDLAERYLRRALNLNPNMGDAHQWYGQLLSLKGQHEDAIREMAIAERLNPQSPSVLVTCAFTFRNARRYEKCVEKLRQSLRIQPHYYIAEQAFSWTVKFVENYEESLRACDEAVRNTNRLGLPLYAYAYTLAVAGRVEEAKDVNRELLEAADRQYVPPIYHALIYTALGDRDSAFEWISKAIDEKDFWVVFIAFDPRFDDLRSDPRFEEAISRIRPGEGEPDIHESRVPTRKMHRYPAPDTSESEGESSWYRNRWITVPSALGVLAIFTVLGLWSGVLTLDPGSKLATAEGPGRSSSAPERKAIAIMPFKTDSHAPDEASLGVGLAESLYRRLGVVRQLSVRPALINLDDNRSATEIGESFGVAFVLRGTLEKYEEGFRVSTELLDTKSGKIIWAERFDETAKDFPTLQTEIADRVLSALTIRLSTAEKDRLSKRYTEDSEAFQLYLAGRFTMRDRSADNLKKAIGLFEKARDRDPGFSLAYVGLADAYSLLNLYQVPPPDDAYAKAKLNAEKALAIDGSLAAAHASLAYVLFYGDWNRSEAIVHFRKAIELNPSYSIAHHWFALALAASGDIAGSKSQIEQAIELEPQSPIVYSAAGLVNFYAGKYTDALEMTSKSLELYPGLVPAHKTTRVIYEALGDAVNARKAYLKERSFVGNTDESVPGWAMITAQIDAVAGERQKAEKNLKRALSSPTVTDNPRAYAYEIAVAYALLDEQERSIDWLKKARDAKDHSFNFVLVDPRLKKVRDSERFQKIVDGAFR